LLFSVSLKKRLRNYGNWPHLSKEQHKVGTSDGNKLQVRNLTKHEHLWLQIPAGGCRFLTTVMSPRKEGALHDDSNASTKMAFPPKATRTTLLSAATKAAVRQHLFLESIAQKTSHLLA
jgi:hypothetical protein